MLNWFEDFNEDINKDPLHINQQRLQKWPPELLQTPNDRPRCELARRSLGLEQLTRSYYVDALLFFKSVNTFWT